MAQSKEVDTDTLINILRSKYPHAKFILTLGSDGVIYFDKDSKFKHGIYDVEVVDTTAAGDTFTGYFISSISSGISIEEALRRASVASSLAVAKNGAAVSIPDLKTVLESDIHLTK